MCRSKRVRYRMVFQLVIVCWCFLSTLEVVRADDFEAGRAAANRREFATAYSLWQPLAERGDARAQLALGKMYARGDGVAKDYKTARRYFSSAAAQNNPAAQFNLGKMLYFGDGGPQDHGEAYRLFEQAAQAGVPKARDFLGKLRAKGVGRRSKESASVSSQVVDSASSPQVTSEQPSSAAVLQQDRSAVESASSVAAPPPVDSSSFAVAPSSSVATDPLSPYRTTVVHGSGAVVLRSFRFDPIGEIIIGGFPAGPDLIPTYDSSLFKGVLVTDERELATHLTLAGGGNPESQIIMGFASQYAGNKEIAQEWFSKAAAQDNPQAIFALGNLEFANNHERAFKLYEQASGGGVVAARRNMGYLLLHGMGVEQNKERGKALLGEASKAGDALATDLLK